MSLPPPEQFFLLGLSLLLASCSGFLGPLPATATGSPTETSIPGPTESPSPLPDLSPTAAVTVLPAELELSPEDWKLWPVIPIVTQRGREIYQQGQLLGNDPRAFSVFGDCQSEPDIFMGVYDTDPQVVGQLEAELQETVANFADSFSRLSPTAKTGTTAGALLWYEWHKGEFGCQYNETPVDCELRLHHPSLVYIHVGTHWEARNIEYLRRIINQLIAGGVVPILVTKADGRDPDGHVDLDYATLAVEYDIPLWNFWGAVSELPNRGLYTKPSEPHLGDIYLTDQALEIHRYTALQALDAVWRAVSGP